MTLVKRTVLWTALAISLGGCSQKTIEADDTKKQNQDASIFVDLNVKHSVGGISEFDRSKYVVMHSMTTTADWSDDEDKLDYLLNDLDVYFGRDNGTMTYWATAISQDPNRQGFADPLEIKNTGQYLRENQYGKGLRHRHQYEDKTQMMIGGQLSQFWLGNHTGKGGWTFGSTEAVGEFMGHFVNEFYRDENQGPEAGPKRPTYLEVVNEPLYDLVTVHGGDPMDTFIFHNEVASAIRGVTDKVQIGGYTTAFPWFDDDNFTRWDKRMKRFIDTSGEHMDFFSIHLYDFGHLNRDGGVVNFRGGRIEATMDMMEQYGKLKLGEVKPFMISEYGGRDHITEQTPWTALNDWQTMKSFTPMMLQFMAKPDQVLKAIPFSLAKAEWSGNQGRDYAWRLLRHNDEKEGEKGEHYVFSDIIKFYQLWSDVNGTRVDSRSDEADLLVDSYVDGNKLYVIASNLVTGKQGVEINLDNVDGAQLKQVKVKHLHFEDNQNKLSEQTLTTPLKRYVLGSEASAIFEYTFDSALTIEQTSTEAKYYAKSYHQPIKANQSIEFAIDAVNLNQYGEAKLRLSFGRGHGLSQTPVVTINGKALKVPADFAGDEQVHRPQFFSMLEIPVDYSWLKQDNVVSVSFADDGGFVTSTTLQVFEFSSDIR